MGGKKSKPQEKTLPTNLEKKVKELFYKIDKDRSNTIERAEAKEYWKKNFSQVNTIALFDQVDVDGNGRIEIDEWIQHWVDVYKTGKYTEEYLINEIQSIIDGNAWVNLDNVDAGKGKATKLKKEGKY